MGAMFSWSLDVKKSNEGFYRDEEAPMLQIAF